MKNNYYYSTQKTLLRIAIWGVSLFLSLFFCSAYAAESSQTDAARFATFTQEVRCVVCQNQNLADSTTPLANDLREKIYTMILEKKSDEEIKDYLVKRYGEFILLRPRFNKFTYFLWLFPLLGIGFVLWFLSRFNFSANSSPQ